MVALSSKEPFLAIPHPAVELLILPFFLKSSDLFSHIHIMKPHNKSEKELVDPEKIIKQNTLTEV